MFFCILHWSKKIQEEGSFQELEPGKLKIALYPIEKELLLPSNLRQFHCAKDMYYMEVHWPEVLRSSPYFYPFDANYNEDKEPDYYVIPHLSTCVYHHCVFKEHLDPDHCKKNASNYFEKILSNVITQYPYWNKTSGRDHIVVLSWDQASEVFGFYSPVKKLIQPAVHLTLVGYVGQHSNFDYHKDVVIVPYNDFGEREVAQDPEYALRTMLGYFRGSIFEDNRYSGGVRQYLKEIGNTTATQIKVFDSHSPNYYEELQQAVFSLCPSGWSPWSPRLFDSLMAGAIPVIFADGTRLPMEDILDYKQFSVKLLNEQVYAIEYVLNSIPRDSIIRKQLAVKKFRKHFMYHHCFHPHDAFDMSVLELSQRKRTKPIGNIYYI